MTLTSTCILHVAFIVVYLHVHVHFCTHSFIKIARREMRALGDSGVVFGLPMQYCSNRESGNINVGTILKTVDSWLMLFLLHMTHLQYVGADSINNTMKLTTHSVSLNIYLS